MEYEHIIHTLAPVYNANSRVLILGTMPSPKSREYGFYYGHPQNRFWRALAGALACPVPQSVNEKTDFLLRHGIALWDTLKTCDIAGAADASIKNAVPNDLGRILENADIEMIFTTGKTAHGYYCRYQLQSTGIEDICLPSPSPANARVSLDELTQAYKIIKQYL